MEEMGMSCDLEIKTSFVYKTPFDNGLTEHEYDYILIGHSNQQPVINALEVESYKWQTLDAIKVDLIAHPKLYTSWFKIAIETYF
jgi:isopentenyl-diphosphate delta-isomerase